MGYQVGGELGVRLRGTTEAVRAIRSQGNNGLGNFRPQVVVSKDGDFEDDYDPRKQDHWFEYERKDEDETSFLSMRYRFGSLHHNTVHFRSGGFQKREVKAPKGGPPPFNTKPADISRPRSEVDPEDMPLPPPEMDTIGVLISPSSTDREKWEDYYKRKQREKENKDKELAQFDAFKKTGEVQ